MIWSEHSIDPTAGFDYDEQKGTLVPRKLGCWVMTVEEGWEIINKRKNETSCFEKI